MWKIFRFAKFFTPLLPPAQNLMFLNGKIFYMQSLCVRGDKV